MRGDRCLGCPDEAGRRDDRGTRGSGRASDGCECAGPVLAALLLGLCACGTEKEQPDMTSSDAPPMESVVADYTANAHRDVPGPRRRAGHASRDRVPHQRHDGAGRLPPGRGHRRRTGDAAELLLPGHLRRRRRKQAAEVVWKVGREHGFTRTGTIVDRPDDLEVSAGRPRRPLRLRAGRQHPRAGHHHRPSTWWRPAPTAEAPKTEIPGYDSRTDEHTGDA